MYKSIFLAAAIASPFHVLANIELSGEIMQGGYLVGKTEVGSQVFLNQQLLPVSTLGYYAFGFGRDEEKTFQLKVVTPSGETFEKALTPKKREYKIQRINGIKKSIMKPNPKAVARAKTDNRQVKEARGQKTQLNAFAYKFIAPIKGTITGVYGSQRVFNDVPKNPHFGLDYAGNVGDPVKAPADGIVTLWVPDMFYSGGTMIIDHGHGINSTFLHLSQSYVNQGDVVKQGEVVAAVGKSGRATGPHLDWRVNWHNIRLDPALVLKTHD